MAEENQSSSSTSRCPVNREKVGVWASWPSSSDPRTKTPAALSGADRGEGSSQTAKENGRWTADSLEEAAVYSQTPQHDQRYPLNTTRQVSSIPRGSVAGASAEEDPGLLKTGVADSLPRHQAGTTGEDHSRWVYPSEQQLYNAMRRKGWSNVPETSIPVVLQIHNAVNETTWSRLLEYHQFTHFHPRLVRFQGRPNDVSPKAWFLANVLGYPKPFDRHDWLVEYYKPPVFGDGQGRWIEQRYVIDFYENHRQDRNAQNSSSPTRVDVRPALDSPRALWLIAKRGLQMALPGITNYWYRHRRSKGHPCEGDGTKSFEHERSP